jgi:hypothetical protein
LLIILSATGSTLVGCGALKTASDGNTGSPFGTGYAPDPGFNPGKYQPNVQPSRVEVAPYTGQTGYFAEQPLTPTQQAQRTSDVEYKNLSDQCGSQSLEYLEAVFSRDFYYVDSHNQTLFNPTFPCEYINSLILHRHSTSSSRFPLVIIPKYLNSKLNGHSSAQNQDFLYLHSLSVSSNKLDW